MSNRITYLMAAIAVAIAGVTIANLDRLRIWVADATWSLRHDMQRERGVMVPMRDGTRLSTQVLLPASGDGPFPVILSRTTYGWTEFDWHKFFVQNGYAVVVQVVRGRFDSEGQYDSPHRWSRSDGYDTVDWIVRQPWSNGKVGSFGCSFLGESQIMLAAAKHPNHIALIADGAGGAIGSAENSYGYFGVYENGVLNLASALGWFTSSGATTLNETPRGEDYVRRLRNHIDDLPVIDLASRVVDFPTGYDDVVSHELTDTWWQDEGYISNTDSFTTAGLHVNTWYDQTVHDTFRLAQLMRENAAHPRAKQQSVVVAPGKHCMSGKLTTGPIQVGEMSVDYVDIDYRQLYLDWFDHWLKGETKSVPPNYLYHVMHGKRWERASEWPPRNTAQQIWYLTADATLEQTSAPNPETRHRTFVYDPLNPVPTLGGPICCTSDPEELPGAVDQSALAARDDVLAFQSAVLDVDKELTGNAKAVLYVATDAPDTDFTVKLLDVYPDGKAYNLQDGVFRLRYRRGIDQPMLAMPGEVYRIELELRPIAYRFIAGHRIGLQVSSSNFPRLVRNLNTGEDVHRSDQVRVAVNRVYFGGESASHLVLPVRPIATQSFSPLESETP